MSTLPSPVDVATLRHQLELLGTRAAAAEAAAAGARGQVAELRRELERARATGSAAVAQLVGRYEHELAASDRAHGEAHGSDAATIRQLRADVERLSGERRVIAADLLRSRAEAADQHARVESLASARAKLGRAVGKAPGPYVAPVVPDPPGDRFRVELWPRVESVSAIEHMRRVDQADRALLAWARSELVRALECIRHHEAFVEEVSHL